MIQREMLDAVYLLARMRDQALDKNQLFSFAYFGLYAARARTVSAVHQVSKLRSSMDFDFIEWIFRTLKPEVLVRTYDVESRDKNWAYVRRRGVLVKCEAEDDYVKHFESKYSLWLMPGFISTGSEKRFDSDDTTRVYLALSPKQAPWLLRDVAKVFEQLGIAYSLKTLAHPRQYFRADAAVIYVDRSARALAHKTILDLVQISQQRLRNITPLGTKSLSKGIAWADSIPAVREEHKSFGQWITEVLLEASERFGESCLLEDLETVVRDHGRCLSSVHLLNS